MAIQIGYLSNFLDSYKICPKCGRIYLNDKRDNFCPKCKDKIELKIIRVKIE